MLVLKNITIQTLKGRTLLLDCSFSLNKNDRLAIIGEEGNGKSTLCKLIAGVEDIRNNFGDVLDFGVDRLHDALTCGGYVNAQNKFGSTKEAVQAFVVLFAASVANFIRHANSVAESKDKLLASVEGVIGNAFSNLYDVKTTSDFKHWESQIGRSLPSNPVRIKATSTVDSLFD